MKRFSIGVVRQFGEKWIFDDLISESMDRDELLLEFTWKNIFELKFCLFQLVDIEEGKEEAERLISCHF